LKAQNFVEEVAESNAKISDKFKVKLEKLKKSDNFESTHFGNFNELKRIQKDGRIMLTLPKMKESVELVTFWMEYKTDTDYNWYATTKDGVGSVIILRKGNKYTGHLSLPDKMEYQIMSEEEEHILIKMKPDKFVRKECGGIPKESSIKLPEDKKSSRNVQCFAQIRVLVLRTQNAQNT
jgi:hypothetical protein